MLFFKNLFFCCLCKYLHKMCKEAKGLLNLGGCQSSNFDAQISDTIISMIAYILLTFRCHYEHYESKGALYRSRNLEFVHMTIDCLFRRC